MDRSNQNIQRGRPVSAVDAARANDVFEHFISAGTLKSILGHYRNICDLLHLRPNVLPLFYPKLKGHLNSWKAKAIWKKIDARAGHKCYARGKACPNTRVLIIGAGPCGLRTAIEAQLLGAKVVVIEKRDRMSRNNVLHLWPFVIEDLRALGAKKFFGKFCAGAIDHISIRQLQCILLKVALLLGVEVHTEISFEKVIEPNSTEKIGWRAEFKPTDHPVSQYEFDVIIGADGKRNTLQGFRRKEFRGKLAIAITANFINKRTEAEARVEEISGVAFIFNQKFFKELNAETGIDLENIVYYKDDTHYFVMTAKKPSLIDKGVIKQDYADTARLLAPDNVDREALMNYAREAADFSTNYQMPDLEFAVNHYGQADVAMFDFTSMYAAEYSSKCFERHGYKLLTSLVGDSLLEPFWPTGSGCARGFLSSLDACWAIKAWGSGQATPLEVLAERESIYRLLAQTTPENLNKDCKAYTVDPSTRYPNLNKAALLPQQVLSLYDTDDPNTIELTARSPQSAGTIESHRKRRRRDIHLDPNTLISWIKEQIKEHEDLTVEDITTSLRDGRVLCAILHHYRPDLLDYSAIKAEDVAKNNQLAFDLLEKEIGISPVMTGEDMAQAEVPDYLSMFSYLTQIYDTFRGEIPHIKHPKLNSSTSPMSCPKFLSFTKPSNGNPRNYRTKMLSPTIQQHLQPNFDSASITKPPPSLNYEDTLKPSIVGEDGDTGTQLLEPTENCNDVKELFINRNTREDPLNFTPVKSLEEYTCVKDNEEPTFEKESLVRDETNEYDPNLMYFDENFREIDPKLLMGSHSSDTINSIDALKEKEIGNNEDSISCSAQSDLIIRCVEEDNQAISIQELKFSPFSNIITVKPKTRQIIPYKKYQNQVHQWYKQGTKRCQENIGNFVDAETFKFLCLSNMSESQVSIGCDETYQRVIEWLRCANSKTYDTDFNAFETVTSISNQKDHSIVEKCAEELKQCSQESLTKFIEELKSQDISKVIPGSLGDKFKNKLEPSTQFPAISEKEETDLPEIKEKIADWSTIRAQASGTTISTNKGAATTFLSRISNRSKRHAEVISSNKLPSLSERKTKKRKSLERYDLSVEDRRQRLEEIAANRVDRQNKRRHQRKLQTEQFIKSMQMLHANAKSDSSGPFEDYSLFVYRQTAPDFQDRVKDLEKNFIYVPDRENRLPSHSRTGGADEELAARIKDLEDKWRDPVPVDKKPKDLLRAIGKIESSDWNIKEIEKKIRENKLGKSVNKEKERVPKWNREQFLARQTKMEKKHLNRQNSSDAKFTELDRSIKHLERRLKEGSVRDLGQNKIATITERLVTKAGEPEPKPVPKSNSKAAITLPTQGGSEYCHFCQKRVYLMERLSAEGRFFHRGCFKCQYCHTTLRLGSYLFDKDGQYGHRFYCTQHFGMPGELYPLRTEKKVSDKINREHAKPLEKLKIVPLYGVEGVDLLDRVQTPERIEFANLSAGHISSEHDESLSQMDEDEWTDRNFGASTAEICSSDDDEDSSSISGSESDNEDAYEEALEEPPTKEGTLRWMERYKQRYSKDRRRNDDSDSEDYSSSSDHSSYYENSSGDEEDEPATEGEEEIRARELRKQEVRVEPPVIQTDTGSDTEIVSDESSPESSSKHNSATEISTDSEFAVDDPTPTREIPAIIFNDFNITKTRGSGNYGAPKKVQVKSGVLQSPINNGKTSQKRGGIQLEFTPLVPSPVLPKPAPSILTRTEGYALNRTQSTGGIATKVSLELKKKYLLGDSGMPGSIQKSGSVSTLESKFKSFHTNISDCQKLLKPAPEISPSMQVFCNKLNERRSPLSPIMSHFSDKDPLKSPDLVSPAQETKSPEIANPNISSQQPDITKCANQESDNKDVFEHELEGRPRSPLQDIPIVVPEINWNQTNKTKDSDISSDSLTSDSDSEEHTGIQKSPTVKIFNTIPRVEVHDDAGEILHASGDEIPLDSLCVVTKPETNSEIEASSLNDVPKSITSEKKSLNQPKTLPDLQGEHILSKVHVHSHEKSPEAEVKSFKNASGQSTPTEHDSCIDYTGAALTETELSDWARDSAVSDDFEDVEFELNPSLTSTRKNKQPKGAKVLKPASNVIKKANIEEFDDLGHVCGKEKQTKELKNIENLNNVLSSLEFMDTGGEETSSDEKVLVETALKNNGYMEFQNEDDIPEDSLNPNINVIVETINPQIQNNLKLENLSSYEKNTGYCIIGNENDNNFGGEVINLKESDLEKLKRKQNLYDNEEDSLLNIETGTTTEENTCSDSTVKNLIEAVPEKEKKDTINVDVLINENKALIQRIREEQKGDNKKDENKTELIEECKDSNKQEEEYQEHCQRLQSKVEFGNAKDSIDIRKSKRKENSAVPIKPDLIQEETSSPAHTSKSDTTPPPKVIYTKEEIQKARDENQRLVQEMVMNKMKAQNKSLERKKRSRNSFSPSLSPSRPFDLSRSATTDISSQINRENDNRISMCSTNSSIYSTPDVLLTTPPKKLQPLEKSPTVTGISELDMYSTPISSIKQHPKSFVKQLSVHSSFQYKPNSEQTPFMNPEAFSLPDIQQALRNDDFKTPVAPPRQRSEDVRRTAEKLKQEARMKAKLKSNEDLGLSPEDKIRKLREKINSKRGKENENMDIHVQDSIESLVMNTERRNSLLYSNDTLTKKRNGSFKRSKSGDDTLHSHHNDLNVSKLSISRQSSDVPIRTKSVSEISKPSNMKLVNVDLNITDEDKKLQFCKSDPNLLTETCNKTEKKSKKDRERRKSITKLITDFFGKKKDGVVKNVNNSTSKGFLSRISPKSKSKSMINLSRKNANKIPEEITRTNSFSEALTIQNRHVDNVSPPPIPPLPLNYTGCGPSRCTDDSSDGEWKHQERSSCDTLDQSGVPEGRRVSRTARKAARQAQLKRHRMAQEIQRKLEETEVKTRELEQRGVTVEKALRGETQNATDESDLLKEWFDLMRDLTELRRYERELMVRAQELELEDRHARLQQELRERLDNEEHKTKEDIKVESSIINEMMEIVSKRDSLIALLEQDRLRYSEEDRDFEEQMLVKGLRLTPVQKKQDK